MQVADGTSVEIACYIDFELLLPRGCDGPIDKTLLFAALAMRSAVLLYSSVSEAGLVRCGASRFQISLRGSSGG